MNKIHFHSLDALRFFAFLKVYLLHVPLEGDMPVFSYLKAGGGIGVYFFFVLSGFLISYLLVFDKLHGQGIDIKKFFIRRSLRIWPLFYLVVIIVFLLPYGFKEYYGLHMVGSGYNLDWKYSFTFLENYKMLFEDNFPKTTPLPVFWSLCIEEHFYVFWLISLFFIPARYLLKFFGTCILLAFVSRCVEDSMYHNSSITSCDLFTNLDLFAGGGILGYLVAKDYSKVEKFILGIPGWVRYFIVIFILLFVVFQKTVLPYSEHTVYGYFRPVIIAIIFTTLIAVLIPVDSKIRINSKLLNYLGTISFGLYVYHLIFNHVVLQYCKRQNIKIDDWATLSLYILVTLGGSIIVSTFSYSYFERPFLRLRDRLTGRSIVTKNQVI